MAEAIDRPTTTRRGLARRLQDFLLRPEASVIVVSAALVPYFEIANRNFLTGDNLETLSQFVAAPVIIACGEIMLLICREIDLSVGQVFALAPFVMGFAQAAGLPIVAAIALAVAVSAADRPRDRLDHDRPQRAFVYHDARRLLPDQRHRPDDLARLPCQHSGRHRSSPASWAPGATPSSSGPSRSSR